MDEEFLNLNEEELENLISTIEDINSDSCINNCSDIKEKDKND